MLLEGLKVIEIGNRRAVAYCCKLLADLGAEVVKVEKPIVGDELRQEGPFLDDVVDPERSVPYLYNNANKRGITVNIENASGAEIIRQLLESFDLIVTDYHQDYLERFGLDYATLKQSFSGLIMTSVLPYGNDSEFQHDKAYCINISALSGISSVLGEKEREPLNFPYCSLTAGASAAGATLVAVFARCNTDKGEFVDISEIEVMADLVYDISISTAWGMGKPFKRGGYRGAQYAYPWTMLPVKDGYVTIAFLPPRRDEWWETFLQVIEKTELLESPRYKDLDAMTSYSHEVDELLRTSTERYTKEELFSKCKEAKLPIVPVRHPKEAMEDTHIKEYRGFHRKVSRDDIGELVYPGLPFKSQLSGAIRRPAPKLGEHNEEVLVGCLNLPKESLIKLKNEGVI